MWKYKISIHTANHKNLIVKYSLDRETVETLSLSHPLASIAKNNLRTNPEMFPDVGRFPLWGDAWNSSQRTWKDKRYKINAMFIYSFIF